MNETSEILCNWVITGGCGFIGSQLIAFLRQKHPSIRIRVYDNLSSGTKDDLSSVTDFEAVNVANLRDFEKGVQFIEADILDVESAYIACRGADVVVHLAANTGVAQSVEKPRDDLTSNVIGTFNFLESAKRNNVERFVHASSGAPIGECTPPIHEELAPHPVSPYGASKLAAEGYCSAYFRTYGLETVILRFGNVYGPGSNHKSSVVAQFIRQAFESKPLIIFGRGDQTRDFIYIDDIVSAIWLSANRDGIGGETFQIATNSETTVSQIVEMLLPKLHEIGLTNIDIKNAAQRVGDVLRNFSDTQKAEKMLGWKPRVSLNLGLELTVRWFAKYHSL